MNAGVTCQFHDGVFTFEGVRTLKPEEGNQPILMNASDMTFLNRSRSRSMGAGATDTNIFWYVFYIGFSAPGAIFAMLMGLIGFASSKREQKASQRIIVKFENGRTLSGYTDMETFFAVQNAWLDSRTAAKSKLETAQ